MDNKHTQLLAQQNYQRKLDLFTYEAEQRIAKARRLFPQIIILPILTTMILVLSYPTWHIVPALPWMIGGIGFGMELLVLGVYLAYCRKRTPPQTPQSV